MKRTILLAMIISIAFGAAWAEIGSLAHLFLLGKGIKDTDGDNLTDKIALCLVIPDNPSAVELAVAADIAARANIESLVQDFSLVKRESEVPDIERAENPILIGTNIKWLRAAIKDKSITVPELGPNQGYVAVFATKIQTGIVLVAGSEEALLQTGRAFFLRWPYFWDIWGREEGSTYATLEKDITHYLASDGVNLQRTIVRSVTYEFPPLKKGPGSLKKLSFNAGEIKDLAVDIYVTDEDDLARASKAFDALRDQHRRGEKTEVLSYPGCAQLSVWLRYGKKNLQTVLPRVGTPRRMLTPSFKDTARGDGAGKEFDLPGLFSTKGFYGDMDRDGIPDALDSKVIVPQSGGIKGVTQLPSKLVLNTAGASFPVVYLDKEVENRKTLVAPILVGPNALVQELQRIGKLKTPPLEPGWGLLQVVPRAFNKSHALAFLGADANGLDKVLAYFNQKFPYFDEYGDGRPQVGDVAPDLERFLKGEKGAAEAFFAHSLKKIGEEFKDQALESFGAELYLPQANPRFEDEVKKSLAALIKADSVGVKSFVVSDSKKIFEKDQAFSWEGADAVTLVEEKMKALDASTGPFKISLGLSESPEMRLKIKKKVEALLAENLKIRVDVEVSSSYKQGFYWLLEKVLPALKGKNVNQMVIRFAEEKEDFSRPKRFYSEPVRWLQELYPADEFLARDLGLTLDKIRFEMTPPRDPVYEVIATDAKNAVLLQQTFSPHIREIPYMRALPEWGSVKLTTGWLRIEKGDQAVYDGAIQGDLEKVWDYYQDQVLAPVYAHIQKKTENAPTFTKQPYFKQLKIELWSSEPDYRLGLDEEIVSSLEAMHDEIYFDTLDFLRGITELDVDEQELPEDTSRYSAPGNVFPMIHPSTEGEAPRLKVTFEDWLATAPHMIIKWKEKGKEEASRRIAFPSLKSKPITLPALIYDGLEERVESLVAELDFEKEADYLALLDILASSRELVDKGLLPTGLSYPGLNSIRLKLSSKDMAKEEILAVLPPEPPAKIVLQPLKPGEAIVDTGQILSPEMVQDVINRLGRFSQIRTFTGGRSYEKRNVPVIEIFKPLGKYISVPRLIAQKPTLFLSGRQHANEVSSTNTILKLAELLASDKTYQDFVNKINFVFEPMENPDGAALAYELQKLTPFHSLHAGRYGSLGIDVGSMGGSARPLLPEALVRRNLNAKWFPDIYLNLHGYPSHEWVQPFSNYSPYLFRDYWIPRGWYAYYRYLDLPLYRVYKEAGEELRSFIIGEMQADPKIKDSNKKFYDRYARWATRWQPHLDYLELVDGLNLYSKRRSSSASRLSPRTQMTFVEETPELMDETARGAWLDFLSTQGLTYLRAHLKYLAQAKFETVRVEEESGERVRIQFLRGRPGAVKK
ncbi:MAG: M14 family metallopeptidase [Candidatus Aminicenantes bacterium]|nr:M14 family metallopeptidase [Candidatus Aminicenantes bacterium]